MTSIGAPLTYAPSADSSHPTSSRSLPPEVIQCLKNTRFLHLATCIAQTPHISLMNYTYLPASPFWPYPAIIMTTNPSSKKTHNLLSNPRVSLLVHDWMDHRPPTRTPDPGRERSPPPQASQSQLAMMLLNMNASELARISVTINGDARVAEGGSEEERWCKDQHLQNNTFRGPDPGVLGSSPGDEGAAGDGGRGYFIEDAGVRVVIVKIKDGRTADSKGSVSDWIIEEQEQPVLNGV